MTTTEFLNELLALLSQGPHSDSMQLELRLIFRQLHDSLTAIQLGDGGPIRDVSDFREFCREIIVHLSPPHPIRPPRKPMCSVCFHRHEGVLSCDVDLGGAGKCDCKLELSA